MIFDITGQDISLLSDGDLRVLVGRLCEAELRRHAVSPVHAIWGGNQNAADGGVDVRVASPSAFTEDAALPRPNVGFQVKAEDMPRAKILAEMKPRGSIRPSIQELANLGGSYIIASSKSSVTDSALADRKQAMRDAIEDIPNADHLHLDFFDGDRIATWVRDHASLVTWVRERISRPIAGWRPYDDWTGSHEGLAGTYMLDDSLRIQGPTSKGESESVLQGMEHLRKILAEERGVVRLVGLSGVGKTRLVQALFDDRIGQAALAPDTAIYANLSDDLVPQPIAVATELVALQRSQVLIVDNCTPALHRRLYEVATRIDSKISLLTVEYDVQDDQPEGTEVFELRPSSDDLIEKLLLRRVEGLSQVNAATIAKFASGNARVALALAQTVGKNESVASLNDVELFQRLFRQRQESNNSLLLSAQACSLAYSFQGEDLSDVDEAELSKLAAAVGTDARTLYNDVVELKRRDLVQQRGVWRALLPHAIANRLAATSLENIPPQDFDRLIANASARLLKSISRRLGYLHKSEAAQKIVKRWLTDGGILGRAEDLGETGLAMLHNVAPVDPEGTIDAIERAMVRCRTAGRSLAGEEFRTLLMSLAFEPELFDRCTALILELIEFEEPGRYANQVRNSFPSLFHLYLSGTHATIEQRCCVVDGLLKSSSEVRQELGFKALEAMLQTNHFSSFHPFDFGARSRDYGWYPKSGQDVRHWYTSVLSLCVSHDAHETDISKRVRKILGEHLRALWSEVELHDEVETICREFQARRFWPEGWTGIRATRRWRGEPLPAAEDAKLASLQAMLAPQSLAEQVRSRVLRSERDAYDDIDFRDYEAQFARQQQDLIELGKTLAVEAATVDGLMGELSQCSTGLTLGPFAKGLVDGTQYRRALWEKLAAAFRHSDPAHRSPELLACYLFNLQPVDNKLAEEILVECLEDSVLSEWFPYFQKRVQISADGLQRLKQSLTQMKAPAERYRGLGWTSKLDDSALLDLVPMILQLPDGFDVAADCIHMRIVQERREQKPLSPELMGAGRIVVEACEFSRQLNREVHAVEEIIEACLESPETASTVELVLGRLRAARSNYSVGFTEESRILGALLVAQPFTVLNSVFAPGRPDARIGARGMFDRDCLIGSPLDRIPEATLLAWCDENSSTRYPLIASKMVPFARNPQTDTVSWKSSALALLEHAPSKIEVLRHYIRRFEPMSWSGSKSATWEKSVGLLDQFANHPDGELAKFAGDQKMELRTSLDELKLQELASERRENETFE
jgi:hypothetical protein